MNHRIQAFFVYGTLKMGQCRASLWPVEPLSVTLAWTRGTLYGRSDYPAMTAGDDRVLGEMWRFAASDMPCVIEAIDRVEGAHQPGRADLYVRVLVEAQTDGTPCSHEAYTYHFATDPIAGGFSLIQPAEPGGWVSWPGKPDS